MSFVGELQAFTLKGHVIDLADGVIIDSALGRIAGVAVGDLIMPLVGLALGLSLIEARPRHPYPPRATIPVSSPKRSPRVAEAGAGAGWR